MRFIAGFVFFFLFPIGLANALESCPSGQYREINEVVVKPAIIEDVYGELATIISNSTRERVTPAEIEWVDIPKDYERPKTITYTTRYKFAPTYKPIYEPYVFREESFDNVRGIDGKVSKRRVPAIRSYKTKYVIDPDTASSRTETKTIPYNPLEMEKDGKIFSIVEPVTIELLNPQWIGKMSGITNQKRIPAEIKQTWGDCIPRE